MAEPSPTHLLDLLVMARVERSQAAAPTQRLRVVRITALSRRHYRPNGVQLSVLTEQVPVAQDSGIEIPDTHPRTT